MAYTRPDKLGRARILRKEDTESERQLWEKLRARRLNGFKFVRQLPIGPYFADLACRERRHVVEVDGVTHTSDAELRHDRMRTSFPEAQGYCVLRVWSDDVFKNMDAVLDGIVVVLEERA